MGIGSGVPRLEKKKEFGVIVGHVRPGHIDEACEHCGITFSFVKSAWGT